jgi:signal peptidase
MKLLRTFLQVVLFVLVLFLGILVIFTGKRDVKGYYLFVVKSGSMEPTIHTGELIVVKKETSYKVQDIITFGSVVRRDAIVTHRITDIKMASAAAYFVTKGDANKSADTDVIPTSSVLGKYQFGIPLVGYPIGFAGTPLGAVVLVIIPSTLILWEEVHNLQKLFFPRKKIKHPKSPKPPKSLA